MIPVLRVVLPALSLTETLRSEGGEAHNFVSLGLNVDYITDDRTGTKPVPAAALYAARMNAAGVISVARARSVALPPDHTFAGWPIPA